MYVYYLHYYIQQQSKQPVVAKESTYLVPKGANYPVGIDITDDCIRISELISDSNGLILHEVANIKLSEGVIKDGAIVNPEEVTAKLRSTISTHQFINQYAAASISDAHTISRTVTYQWDEETPLKDEIAANLSSLLPLDSDDYIVDFEVIGESLDASGKRELLLYIAALPKAIGEAFADAIELADLKLLRIDLESFALARLVKNSMASYFSHRPNVPRVIIYLKQKTTMIVITVQDNVYFSKSINAGLDVVLSCEDNSCEQYREWSEDIALALAFFKGQYSDKADPEKIELLGLPLLDGDKAAGISEMLDLEVTTFDPYQNIRIANSPAVLMGEYANQFALSLGVALGGESD